MTKAEPIRIFLVDDHPLVRAALEQLLAGHGHAVSGQAGSPAETLAHPALTRSHLVVVDLALDKENGMSLIPALRARRTPVLVYSMHESAHIIRQALAAGALGYVTKREAADSLLAAIHAVRQGEIYLSPRAAAALRTESPLAGLSGQQLQIYRRLGQGLANEEIARQLGISVRTLESYCVRIMDKLGVQGAKELRQHAIRAAIATGPDQPSP